MTVIEQKGGKDRVYNKKRDVVVKTAILFFLAFILFILATIAWFAMNKNTSTEGMGARVATDRYMIVPLDGITSIYQEYYDYISDEVDSSMEWKMTAENNMDNYEGDAGISPGAYGTISFYVKPSDDSINLDMSFEIVGYKYSETTDTVEGEDVTTKTMTRVSDELQGYLAGHIFLFENRTPVYDDPESEDRVVVSYTYSNPILSNSTLSKVITNRAFNKADENTPVNIYWVWPKTLSTLVDATDNPYVSIEPFCDGNDYLAVVGNVISYPARYMYRYSDVGTTLTPEIISNQYETYGDLYDRADNEIGLNVSFITLKMASSESSLVSP